MLQNHFFPHLYAHTRRDHCDVCFDTLEENSVRKLTKRTFLVVPIRPTAIWLLLEPSWMPGSLGAHLTTSIQLSAGLLESVAKPWDRKILWPTSRQRTHFCCIRSLPVSLTISPPDLRPILNIRSESLDSRSRDDFPEMRRNACHFSSF